MQYECNVNCSDHDQRKRVAAIAVAVGTVGTAAVVVIATLPPLLALRPDRVFDDSEVPAAATTGTDVTEGDGNDTSWPWCGWDVFMFMLLL